MSNITSHFISFHAIDLACSSIVSANIAKSADVVLYANDLVENIIKATDQRAYEFTSKATEVCSTVLQMVGETNCDNLAQTIANRLLKMELVAQDALRRLGVEIQKGSLFQIVFERNGVEMILITKVDLNSFLDQTDFKKHAGLPFEKRILKTCLIEFSSDKKHVQKVTVCDANNAKYWWDSFLELRPVTSDETNTKTAFLAVDLTLAKRLKRNFPSDYTYLRNNLIGYFRTHSRFDFNDFQTNVFGSYQPDDKSLKMNELISAIQKLPTEKKFDNVFNVVETEIKARFRRVIALTDKIKLELTEDVANLSNTIEAKEIGGIKGIFIKSQDGYAAFHTTN